MFELPMRGHFRYLRFKTFPMTPRTLQCEVFCPLLSSSKHSGVPEDSQPPTFPSVELHPHTWPKWGCDIMFRKGGWKMCSWRNVMMGRLRAMVVQNAPQHSLRSPTINQTWKMMQRSMWKLVWHANKIKPLTKSKRVYYNLCQFPKGRGKVCPRISW